MGINIAGLRFLLYAKSIGVDFTKTAMIGRQSLRLSFEQFSKVIRSEFKYNIERKALKDIYSEKYCDKLLEYLGAKVIHSFDYSGYEGATYIHDFNTAIPEEFFAQYTAVIEGGTLEHIFNFPTAIKNCMQMIKVGGHYIGHSPTNNYMGHGFYQLSPELYFRVFSPGNGFRIEHIILHEGKETRAWFDVPDPECVKHRVGIRNSTQTLLLILATRMADCQIFSTHPQQSDYVLKWSSKKKEKVKLTSLQAIIRRFKSIFRRSNIPPFFTPFDPLK